jgi:hypothetical protein
MKYLKTFEEIDHNKLWFDLRDYVFEKYPEATEEWNFPGKKYGWSYRIKDRKRAIIYFLPRQDFFKVAFVFGQKAYDAIMQSDIAPEIKITLQQAVRYAEGRGIRLDVKSKDVLPDVKKLIEIKLNH